MTDVFAVQDEIAGAIVTRLRGGMHAEAEKSRARGGTKNLEAYELLLKGRALQGKRGRFLPQAVACFERAIALDPDYAEAMAWLSDSYRLIGTFGGAPPMEVMPKAKALAERALSVDSELAEAWSTLAAVEEQYERNFARSDALYQRALELDPRHSRARAQRALWRAIRGAIPMPEAIAEVRRAVQDDPLNAWVGGMHSYLLAIGGMHEESIVEAERSFRLDEDSFFAHWNVMRSHAWGGNHQRALREAPSLLGNSGRNHWALGLLAWTHAQADHAEQARAVYDELEARSRHEFVSRAWLAVAAGSAGLDEQAIAWAERTVAEHDPLVLWARSLVFWDPIRKHPRFREVMRGVWE
jgi:serine/threonine-protein kinase